MSPTRQMISQTSIAKYLAMLPIIEQPVILRRRWNILRLLSLTCFVPAGPVDCVRRGPCCLEGAALPADGAGGAALPPPPHSAAGTLSTAHEQLGTGSGVTSGRPANHCRSRVCIGSSIYGCTHLTVCVVCVLCPTSSPSPSPSPPQCHKLKDGIGRLTDTMTYVQEVSEDSSQLVQCGDRIMTELNILLELPCSLHSAEKEPLRWAVGGRRRKAGWELQTVFLFSQVSSFCLPFPTTVVLILIPPPIPNLPSSYYSYP